MNKFVELAKQQFYDMKEEYLDDDRHCIGGENTQKYDENGIKFTIFVYGCWEKSEWFDYEIITENNKILKSGSISIN